MTYTIRSADGLRNSGLGQDEIKPVEIGLVRVRGRVLVGYEGRRATGAIVDIGRRERDSLSVLDIQISLSGKGDVSKLAMQMHYSAQKYVPLLQDRSGCFDRR